MESGNIGYIYWKNSIHTSLLHIFTDLIKSSWTAFLIISFLFLFPEHSNVDEKLQPPNQTSHHPAGDMACWVIIEVKF